LFCVLLDFESENCDLNLGYGLFEKKKALSFFLLLVKTFAENYIQLLSKFRKQRMCGAKIVFGKEHSLRKKFHYFVIHSNKLINS